MDKPLCQLRKSTAQSTTALCVWVSTDIFVKSFDVNESVILQVIVDPSVTDTDNDTFVTLEAIKRFELAVSNDPESILYSTL